MKAVRIHTYGGPGTLTYETDVPEPALAPDALLIEVIATSVNPIDWKVRSGTRQKDFPLSLPAILGKDVSGVVRSIGSEVRHFKTGDRVLAMADATYAQFVSVKAEYATHLPDGLDPVDAAAIPLVALTGDQLVRLVTRAEKGQTILVTGALGSVGRAAVYTARKVGAKVIAGVRRQQLGKAEELGASRVIAIDDDAAIAGLEPVDGIADTVGGETAAKLLGRIRPGGRFGYASFLPPDAQALNPAVEIARVFARPDASKIREFADAIRDHVFALPISQRLPLREAAKAHALMEAGGAGKIVLVV